MPVVDFSRLPGDARVWVFAASDAIDAERQARLLFVVDAWLARWQAHGASLTCARDWRECRFLAIGVDQSLAGASGCSIDALFRVLQDLQQSLGVSLVGGSRVYYRARDGAIHSSDRDLFRSLGARGAVDEQTPVFDTSLTTAAEWRTRFERPARDSWHRELLSMPRG